MAAERGAGQQQSQEMMEGERPHRAVAERPSRLGVAARTDLAREKRGCPPPTTARALPCGP